MGLIDDIEEKFFLVKKITFDFSVFENHNDWISFHVNHEDIDTVIKAHKELIDKFKNGKRIMTIKTFAYTANISLINETNGDVVNIKNKEFDFDQYPIFLKRIKKERIVDLRVTSGDVYRTNGQPLDFFLFDTRNSP